MPEHDTPLYHDGPYRILARRGNADGGYVVVDSAGTPLRHEPDFDDARAWVQARRRADDAATPAPSRACARSRRG